MSDTKETQKMREQRSIEQVYNAIKTAEQAEKMGIWLLSCSHAFVQLAQKLKADEKGEQGDTPNGGQGEN